MHAVAASALRRSLRLLPAARTCSPPLLARAINTTTGDAAGAGDPAVHSRDPPEDAYPERAPKFSGAEHKLTNHDKNKKEEDTGASPPLKAETIEIPPPFAPPPPKLESCEVPPPPPPPGAPPSLHQTRQRRSLPYSAARVTTAESFCERADSVLLRLRHGQAGGEGKGEGEEDAAVAELREYYKSHKPSPLSGVEVADTRKPITQATSHGGPGDEGRGAMAEEETVDDALSRAERMFRAAAERGNPAWPHSRALARMLLTRRGAATAVATIFA